MSWHSLGPAEWRFPSALPRYRYAHVRAASGPREAHVKYARGYRRSRFRCIRNLSRTQRQPGAVLLVVAVRSLGRVGARGIRKARARARGRDWEMSQGKPHAQVGCRELLCMPICNRYTDCWPPPETERASLGKFHAAKFFSRFLSLSISLSPLYRSTRSGSTVYFSRFCPLLKARGKLAVRRSIFAPRHGTMLWHQGPAVRLSGGFSGFEGQTASWLVRIYYVSPLGGVARACYLCVR